MHSASVTPEQPAEPIRRVVVESPFAQPTCYGSGISWRRPLERPADRARRIRSPVKSVYNPHYPYSLCFNVNTDGDVREYPRSTFWKAGSGGHIIFIVPSHDLVVWKLAGRDDQYDERKAACRASAIFFDRPIAKRRAGSRL